MNELSYLMEILTLKFLYSILVSPTTMSFLFIISYTSYFSSHSHTIAKHNLYKEFTIQFQKELKYDILYAFFRFTIKRFHHLNFWNCILSIKHFQNEVPKRAETISAWCVIFQVRKSHFDNCNSSSHFV